MPSTVGDRFLMIRANDSEVQGETTYDDNHLFRQISIVAPDLQIGDLTAPAEGGLGEPIVISYEVSNPSTVPALAHWQDRVYLSNDQTLDAGDLPIPSGAIDAPTTLAGGESYIVSREITLPRFPVGQRYLIVQTDAGNVQLETDETNNIATAVPIQLRASDLTSATSSCRPKRSPDKRSTSPGPSPTQATARSATGPIGYWCPRIRESAAI